MNKKIKDKVIDDLNKKVESDADEFKKKYPEIADMTLFFNTVGKTLCQAYNRSCYWQ